MTPLLKAWLASLDQKERIIHELAVRMLKTRYDPARSNSFLNFVAAQKPTA
jgi:hypothetical protein